MCKPYTRQLRVITGLAAAFSIICFADYLFMILTNGGFTVFSVGLPVLVLCVLLLPLLFARRAAKRLPAWLYRTARALYTFGVCFYTITFVLFCGMLAAYSAKEPVNTGKTAVLVYGCRVKGREPGRMLTERLDAAYTLLSENPESVALVSGGLDTGEQYTEGQVMAWYLASRGIAKDRIFIDETAETTKGNIRGFLEILDKEGFSAYPCISVSSEFHIPRILYLCRKFGLHCEAKGAESRPFTTLFPNIVREYMAYIKMFVFQNAA